nr:hypothetical protein [Tanacetum cinerariifolium]
MEITDTIDGKVKVVTEASVRRHLKLEDSDGISILPTTEIFEQHALIGAKNFRVKDQQSQQETKVPLPSSPTHTDVVDKAASIGVDVRHGGAATTVTSLDPGQGSDIQRRYEQDIEFDFDALKELSTAEQVSTADATVTTASVDISPASPTRRVSTADDITNGRDIVPEQGMNVEALQTKYPIIDWEIYTKDTRKYWKIIKVENHTEGACVFTNKWSLNELAYGVPTNGPYQANPPSPDDIISYIRIDREGQPLEEIIQENVFCLGVIEIMFSRVFVTCFIVSYTPKSSTLPIIWQNEWSGSLDKSGLSYHMHPEWFSQKKKPPTPDRDWNKTLSATHGSIQPWISKLAKQSDSCSSFNELIDTLVDFSAFLMNRLKVDTLTPKLLAGPTYELMKGSYKSLVELEFFLEEVYKATTDQLDWVNPEGQQYPHNLLKPLPLILNSRGRCVIPFDHFINNDLEYLRGGAATSMQLLSPRQRSKRQQFYGFAVNRESARDVYSKHRIIIVTELKIIEWHNYKHLDWITMRRDDDKLYKFKEDTYRSDLKRKEAYIVYSNPRGFIYQNKDKQNRLMRIDELHKFSDGTLTDVRTALDDRLKGIRMKYLPQTVWRKSDKDRAAAMI